MAQPGSDTWSSPSTTNAPIPGLEHARLAVLTGHWHGRGRNAPTPDAPEGEPFSTDARGEWIADDFFVQQRGTMDFGGFSLWTLQVFGWDADAGEYVLHGFDNTGVSRRYRGQWAGELLRLESDGERVELDCSEGAGTLHVRWEQRAEDGAWVELCRYTAHRQGWDPTR